MATAGKMFPMKKLPVGYRLNPSEEDIIYHHLKRKLDGVQEEYCLIPEFDIYKLPPCDLITKFNVLSDLASDGWECFFYHRRSSPHCKKISRRTPGGFWKGTGEGRKPQVTDRMEWRKNYLVHYNGKQKQADKSGWAMHEYMIISDPSIVLCRIHKNKPKVGKEKVDSVSSDAGSNGSSRATAFSEIQVEPQETSPEASTNTTMESQSLTPSCNINVVEYSTSPHQTQIVAEETASLGEDARTDSLHLADLRDPLPPRILTREKSPCPKNTFTGGSDQGYDSRSCPRGVSLEEGGRMSIFPQTHIVQSSNVFLGSASPAQQPQARLVSMSGGPEETNFKEAPQSSFDSQSLLPPNLDLLSPEQLPMLQELSSKYNILPPLDDSERGSPNTSYFGESCESLQTNPEGTRELVTDSPAESEDIDLLLDSFLASSPPPVVNWGELALPR